MPLYTHCAEVTKSGKNVGLFLRGGWTELRQTGGEDIQTIPSEPVCFRILKSCPVSVQRPVTDGQLQNKTG